ncbi:hypothetical protein PV04_07640 [Phialophora macrospora]|uniref:Uncharacterized protein n=1 Tax=Phialophora macrospora TaxID=1851006 RepID=A0A0D2FET4_9EURO|nr:hypothetical protein PV04_07640 [Phialophora macrospora]
MRARKATTGRVLALVKEARMHFAQTPWSRHQNADGLSPRDSGIHSYWATHSATTQPSTVVPASLTYTVPYLDSWNSARSTLPILYTHSAVSRSPTTRNPTLTMPSQIPGFYRLFFPTLDPLIALTGSLTHLLSPATILTLYNPSAALPPAIETTTLLDIIAAYLLATTPLQIIMLRLRPDDVPLWKCLQGSLLVQDVGIVAAVVRSLSAQGRLSPGLITGGEWGNLVILGGVGILRAGFLLGVGLGKGRGKGKTA